MQLKESRTASINIFYKITDKNTLNMINKPFLDKQKNKNNNDTEFGGRRFAYYFF